MRTMLDLAASGGYYAAALAKDQKAELVTGDPEFKALEKKLNGDDDELH